MSRRLAPFSVALAHPSDPAQLAFQQVVRPLRSKMDLATNPVLKSFLAGSFSGTCSTILFQPLDLVKTRQQQQTVHHKRGMYAVVRHVLHTEHVTGLWRGILPSITRTVPGVGLYFASLHWLKSTVNMATGETPSPLQAVCLGMAARSVAGVAMIPITVIKTRFESGAYNYHRMSEALYQIYAREGVRGLCCGLAPTLARDAPYSGIYLMFYTQLKRHVVLPAAASVDSSTNAAATLQQSTLNFGCGLAAGFLASLVTHPADVVKTRMQLRPAEYASVASAVSKIVAESGPRGLLVGLAPRMLRRTLMSALAWTVYEEIMRQVGLK